MPWENNRPTHVPTALREATLDRDGHQCTATMHNGHRCEETTHLEAAHLQGWVQGERTTLNNLRTLCHWHHNKETQAEAAAARAKNPRSINRPSESHPGLR